MHRYPPNIVSSPFPGHLRAKLGKKGEFLCKLRLQNHHETM